MQLSGEQLAQYNQWAEEAFSSRHATADERGKRLFVDIPDEDGYAGWLENLRFFGMVEIGPVIVAEADYPRRQKRRNEVFRLNRETGEFTSEVYEDGQAELMELHTDILLPNFRFHLREARGGAPFRMLVSNDEPHFFAAELQDT